MPTLNSAPSGALLPVATVLGTRTTMASPRADITPEESSGSATPFRGRGLETERDGGRSHERRRKRDATGKE
jgi:hypothetical protein